jgi:hypothetical protein
MSKNRRVNTFELVIKALILILTFLLFSQFDVLQKIVKLSAEYEYYEADEIISTLIVLSFCMTWFSYRRWRETLQVLGVIETKNKEIQNSLDTIKILVGIIPICMQCKDIRDDTGSWHQLESYISEHTDAKFSHGICEKCQVIHYPELAIKHSKYIPHSTDADEREYTAF